MQDNPGHVAAAENIIQQLKQGKIPSLPAAVEAAGYKRRNASIILKPHAFQKILWQVTPYELVARAQKRQIEAAYIKRVPWGYGADEKKIARIIIEHEDWKLLRMWKSKNGILNTIIEFPDYDTIDRALDKLYKLGGFYAAEKVEHQVTRPLEEMSEQEIDKMIAQHSQQQDVKRDTTTPNVITGLPQADIIEGEPIN